MLASLKGHNVTYKQKKKTGTNPNLYIVNMNAYIRFGEILSICSPDIE